MIAILKKELWSYFGNWSAWIIIGAFSFVSALFLFFFENDFNILDIGTASLQSFFTLSPWLFLFIIPALAMKSFAEEQQQPRRKREKEVLLPITYKDLKIDNGYRIDLLVEDKVVVELKTVEELHNAHFAQVLTYLKFGNYKLGLTFNFNEAILKNGIKRIIN